MYYCFSYNLLATVVEPLYTNITVDVLPLNYTLAEERILFFKITIRLKGTDFLSQTMQTNSYSEYIKVFAKLKNLAKTF